ncbi:hypothetical protein Tco_0793073 [Tanacetum coccineum]
MEACHLTLCFWGVSVYAVGDVLNYAFFALHSQSTGLQTKLLQHARIVPPGPTFDDALCGSVLRFGIDYERYFDSFDILFDLLSVLIIHLIFVDNPFDLIFAIMILLILV